VPAIKCFVNWPESAEKIPVNEPSQSAECPGGTTAGHTAQKGETGFSHGFVNIV